MINKILLGVIAVFFLSVLGCNTVAGLGKDVEKLGDKIEDKAQQKKSY
jgi:entericidin A